MGHVLTECGARAERVDRVSALLALLQCLPVLGHRRGALGRVLREGWLEQGEKAEGLLSAGPA